MKIKAKKSILDNIEIAAPCTVSWDAMKGTDFARNCGQCKLSVYNISEMSKIEAENLIQNHQDRLCIRLYRRFDGTVITNDCPIGLRKIKQSFDFAIRAAATLLSLFLSFNVAKAQDKNSSTQSKQGSSRMLMGKLVARKDVTKDSNSNKGRRLNGASSGPLSSSKTKELTGEPVVKQPTVMMGSPIPQKYSNQPNRKGNFIQGRFVSPSKMSPLEGKSKVPPAENFK